MTPGSWVADALRRVADLFEEKGIDLGGPLYHDPTGQALTPEAAVALVVPLAEPTVLDAGEDGPAWRQGVVLDELLPLVGYGMTDAAVARACRFRADRLDEDDEGPVMVQCSRHESGYHEISSTCVDPWQQAL